MKWILKKERCAVSTVSPNFPPKSGIDREWNVIPGISEGLRSGVCDSVMSVSQPAELGILDWMDRVQHEPPPKNYHHAGEIQAALDKHPELVTKLSQVF